MEKKWRWEEKDIKVLLSAVEDSNPGVRSMALFGIGNITHAILSGKMENEIKKVPFNRLCETTYKKLDDVNDKVGFGMILNSNLLSNYIKLYIVCDKKY